MYGYVTPLKLKIILALALTDAVVRDANIISVRLFSSSSSSHVILMRTCKIKKIFKALHWAYYRSAANPFLKLHTPLDAPNEHLLEAGSPQWMSFRRRVDEVARAAGALPVDSSS